MTQNELLTALKHEIGIPDLCFNDDGVLRLVSDNDLVIDLEVAEGRLYVYIPIGRMIDLDLVMARMLLSANMFVRSSCGAAVALDESFGEILLNRYFDMETLDIQNLVKYLEMMMSRAIDWKERLLNWDPDGDKEAKGKDVEPNVQMFKV